MTEKTKKFIQYLKTLNFIDIEEKDNNYEHYIIYENKIIGIILHEYGNDFIYLIFDVLSYISTVKNSYDIFGYYNTHFKKQKKECIYFIKKELQKYKAIENISKSF